MSRRSNNFLQRNWHSITMVVFLAVVVLDLIIFPVLSSWDNTRISVVQMVQLASTFKDSTSQLEALKILHEQSNYVSMTLSSVSGNFFYTAFAAILATGAYTRGKENIAAINSENQAGAGMPPIPSPPGS